VEIINFLFVLLTGSLERRLKTVYLAQTIEVDSKEVSASLDTTSISYSISNKKISIRRIAVREILRHVIP
jgi:hypothetical protein